MEVRPGYKLTDVGVIPEDWRTVVATDIVDPNAPICYGVPIVFIPTMRFIKRPNVWLDTMHRHRGTASFAPNFAYALVTRRVRESDMKSWDLSCVKVLGCGAEPIQPETMRQFTEQFATKCGLPRTAILRLCA